MILKKSIDNTVLEKPNQPKHCFGLQEICHDVKNSLFAIAGYLELDEYDKAKQKIKNICEFISSANSYNPILDSLIASKVSLAKSCDIKFHITSTVKRKIKIDEFDLCIALGNAIDNAIEACQKIPKSQDRYIELIIVESDSYLNVFIINPVSKKVEIEDNNIVTSKKENYSHGFGMKSIRNIAQQHDGNVSIVNKCRKFSIHIKLKLG